ncbi:MAG TPA: WYL domain-containing protein [Actinomycetota bacterium]|nr:WYL domain-containing protein [Actinomycetota bacterium]
MSSAAPSALDKRLTRILLLIPYLLKNPGTTTGELAERFGVAEEVVSEDLQLVYVCGLPGYGPGDLIDVSFTGDQVFVDTADYFGAPLRLTPAEALALYAGGQAVLELPGMEEAGALRRALRKLGAALGAGRPESSVEVHLAGGPARHMEVLGRALTDSRRVRMEYFSASRGVLTERTIDPWGLVATLGRWYLVAFDHLSSEERMFRVDRIKGAELLDEAAEVPADFDPSSYREVFRARPEQEVLSFEISAETSGWFIDSYPCRSVTELDDGWFRVELVAGGRAGAAALLLRLGPHVRAVEPDELRQQARTLAAAIAARHRA